MAKIKILIVFGNKINFIGIKKIFNLKQINCIYIRKNPNIVLPPELFFNELPMKKEQCDIYSFHTFFPAKNKILNIKNINTICNGENKIHSEMPSRNFELNECKKIIKIKT